MCFFEKDILQKNIAKLRSRGKSHLFYHCNYILWEEPECLREPELHHMKENHVHSKKVSVRKKTKQYERNLIFQKPLVLVLL